MYLSKTELAPVTTNDNNSYNIMTDNRQATKPVFTLLIFLVVVNFRFKHKADAQQHLHQHQVLPSYISSIAT